MVGKLQDLQNELNQGYRITVSDGSFCDGKGTAPWIIEGKDNTHRLIGVWKTPGIPEDQSSYPSKLWGLYGILLTLLHIALNNGKPKLELACDGQASLQRAFSTYPINPTEAQADILLAIHKLRKTCQYTLSWSHIKGHQDRKEITTLPWVVWLDIKANDIAQKAILTASLGLDLYHIPYSAWVYYLDNKQVVKNMWEKIQSYVNSPMAEEYWKKQRQISPIIWNRIDWESLEATYKKLQWGGEGGQPNSPLDILVMGRIWYAGIFRCQQSVHVANRSWRIENI